jgi:hypothetical protein
VRTHPFLRRVIGIFTSLSFQGIVGDDFFDLLDALNVCGTPRVVAGLAISRRDIQGAVLAAPLAYTVFSTA